MKSSSYEIIIQQEKNIHKKLIILELNIMKKAWKPYANIEIKGTGIKKIIAFGTRVGGEDAKEDR